MRRVGTATVLAAALVAAGSAPAKDALPRCAWSAPQHGPRGLPATLSLETRCADFQLQPNGSLRPQGHGIVYGGEAPRGTVEFADGTWWQLRGGRLEANRGVERLWRSHGRYLRVFQVEAAAAERAAVAFKYRQRLFVAAGVRERAVAHGEWPLGWTRERLLFTARARSDAHEQLRLRARDGTFLAVVAEAPRATRFDRATRTLLVVTRSGALVRLDGRRRTELADLSALGLPVTSWVEPLAGGLIGLTAAHRVVVLRADGSFFGSARFPRGRRWGTANDSRLAADPKRRAVALTMTEGNTGYASQGAEWLFVLREGDRVARALRRERLRFAVCERWTTLAWHEGWLLYSTTEGGTLAVDTNRRRIVDLTPLVARLPGAKPNGERKVELRARWAIAQA
jgi:hypothetical protein